MWIINHGLTEKLYELTNIILSSTGRYQVKILLCFLFGSFFIDHHQEALHPADKQFKTEPICWIIYFQTVRLRSWKVTQPGHISASIWYHVNYMQI